MKQGLPKEEYDQFKGALWRIRQRPRDLGEEEKKMLANLFSHSPVLLMTYLYACSLTEIFERHLTKVEAEEWLRAWMRLVSEQGSGEFREVFKDPG